VRFVYHRPGKGTSVFEQRQITDWPALKVLELAHYDGPPIRVGQDVVLEPGARVLWFVIPGAWYDVGRFHQADGRPTGWYTNFCTPVVIDGAEWRSTDLFLDHWLPTSGPGRWLDEDELAAARSSGLLPAPELSRLDLERARVTDRLAARDWPPPAVRRWIADSEPNQRSGSVPKPGGV